MNAVLLIPIKIYHNSVSKFPFFDLRLRAILALLTHGPATLCFRSQIVDGAASVAGAEGEHRGVESGESWWLFGPNARAAGEAGQCGRWKTHVSGAAAADVL